MSLILDALRKSEAERQRGQAPGLFTPMAPLPLRRRRSSIAPWLIAIFLPVAGAIAFWSLRERSPTQPLATEAARSDSSATTGIPPAAAPAAQVAATSAPAPTTPVATRAPALQAAAATDSAAASAVATATPAVAPNAPTIAAVATADPAPSVAVAAETEYLPRLSELDAGRRGNLPPLKLSMHVWSEQPERRIAIIDGQRVAEGAGLAGGVVAEIRRDGVVLELDGRRYLLPRP